MCPSRDVRSNWVAIGCKRGPLKSHMPSLNMCPQSDLENIFHTPELYGRPSASSNSVKELDHEDANWILIKRRLSKNLAARHKYSELDTFIANLKPAPPDLHDQSNDSREHDSGIVDLGHGLNDELLGIIWSVHDSPASKSVLRDDLKDIAMLLHAGGMYQGESNCRRFDEAKKNMDDSYSVGLMASEAFGTLH